MGGNAKWQLCVLWLTGAFGSLSSLPVAQNPMETFGVGVFTAMTSMADTMSKGAMARDARGISSDFFNISSKSEVGTGEAIAENSRRRKRNVENQLLGEENLLPLDNAAHPHQHRGKRSPCHTLSGAGGSGGTGGAQFPNPIGDGTDYSDYVERKRKQRKRNASQRKKGRTTSKKTKRKLVSRRRRESPPAGPDMFDETGKKISQTVQEFADTMKSFMGTMVSMAQTVSQTVKGTFSEGKEKYK